MITFNWVEWSNFLSNGAAPTRFNITSNLTNLIRGTNGAGKTTLIDALLYGLFNKPLRKVNLPQLVNSVNKKKMLVKVNFTINGVTYEVHRGQKPKVFDVLSDHSGEMKKMDSTNDLQKLLEDEILNTNYKTFTQVVIMASMKYTNFMDLQPADRRIVVNQMLDLEVLTIMIKLLSDRLKEVKLRQSGVEGKHNELQIKMQGVQRLIDAASTSNDGQLEEFDKWIESLTGDLTAANEQMDVLRGKNTAHHETMPVVDVAGINAEISTIRQSINDANASAQVANAAYNTDFKTAQFYAAHDSCDRCNQPIDADFKKNVLGKLQCACVANQDVMAKSHDAIEQYNATVVELNDSMQVLRDWEMTTTSLLNEATQLQNRMQTLNKQKLAYISQKQAVIDKDTDDVGKYQDELDKLNEGITSIIEARAEITQELELCNICSQMLHDKGLKAKIIKEYLPVINQTINHYLEVMGANYSFMLDEQFNETILSRYRDNFSYGSFSNGEATRINFAIVFMFRKIASLKNTVATNLLIMDEVLDGSVDKQGINDLMAIISSMDKSNIFVISHREEIVDLFDKVITVKKVGNFAEYDM